MTVRLIDEGLHIRVLKILRVTGRKTRLIMGMGVKRLEEPSAAWYEKITYV